MPRYEAGQIILFLFVCEECGRTTEDNHPGGMFCPDCCHQGNPAMAWPVGVVSYGGSPRKGPHELRTSRARRVLHRPGGRRDPSASPSALSRNPRIQEGP